MRWSTVALGLLWASTTASVAEAAESEAAAGPNQRSRAFSRLFAGFSIAANFGVEGAPGSGKHDYEAYPAMAGPMGELGGSLGLLDPYVAVAVLGRAHGWNTTWANLRGERRGALDLSIAPELRLPVRTSKVVVFRFMLPFGLSHGWIAAGPPVTLREEFTGGNGFNVGAVGAVDFLGPRYGGYVSLGWTLRSLWFTRRATFVDAPNLTATERLHFLTNAIHFGGGFIFGL